MIMEITLFENNKIVFTINEISSSTGLSKNELSYTIRLLNLKPQKWKNIWILKKDEVIFLLTYLYEIYKLKEFRVLLNE